MTEIILKRESYEVIGACMEVYNQMGCGFVESVYQESLEYELCDRNIPFLAQQRVEIQYKTRTLKSQFIPDFLCFQKLIVEIKACSRLTDQHRAQVHNYLRATGFKLGLLVNFGNHPDMQFERIVR